MKAICPLPDKHAGCCQFEFDKYSNLQHPECRWTCLGTDGKITCATHPEGHTRISDADTYTYYSGESQTDYNKVKSSTVVKPVIPAVDSNVILDQLGMKHLEERREPQQINLQENIYSISENAKKVVYFETLFPNNGAWMNSGKAFIDSLEKAYAKYDLYEDHLVIKCTTSVKLPKMAEYTLDKKVMFIVENGKFDFEQGFYNSGCKRGSDGNCAGDSASTLIYVDKTQDLKKPSISGLIPGGTTFRGLISIDSLNTSSNNKLWLGSNGKDAIIEGAIHNLAQNATLDVTGDGATINLNKNVLSAFSPLACKEVDKQKCKTGGAAKAEYIDVQNRKLTALGYYFY